MNPNKHLLPSALAGTLLLLASSVLPTLAQSVSSSAVNLVESPPVWSMPEANRQVKADPKAKVYIKDIEEEQKAKIAKGLQGAIAPAREAEGNAIERNEANREAIRQIKPDAKRSVDAALASQKTSGGAAAANTSQINAPTAPSVRFEGISHADTVAIGQGFIPPDTNGAAGPKHYVQTVNSCFRVWDKTGKPLTAPVAFSTLFAPLGGPCGSSNDGDPIVLYDQLADRWLISEFCLTASPNFHQLIAISKNGDPTGSYYLYDFMMPNDKLNDYPHFGVWPDAYYMTDNQFAHDLSGFKQEGVFAFDRARMLVGDPDASYIYFDTAVLFPPGVEGSPNGPSGLGGMLPASMDGLVLPPAGAPGLFAGFQADEFGDPSDQLRLFDFHADFKRPANSSFTERPGSPLPVAAFDPVPVPVGATRNVIPQPSPANQYTYLDAITDRLMFRLAYRNLGNKESLVLNHTVNAAVNPNFRAGVRFYELTRSSPTAAFKIAEQETFDGPAHDTLNRWMGSIAMNFKGDLALGYSVSSTTVFPSIRYAAKLASDPAGSGLAQGERSIVMGQTAQTHSSGRWGDYSAMTIDPSDDCSFWYTQEYYPATTEDPPIWHTYVAKVTPGPVAVSPRGTISGKITNCQTGRPVPNALVQISGGFSRATLNDGTYNAIVTPGTYTLSVSAPGYSGVSSGSLTVKDGGKATFATCLQGYAEQPVADAASVTSDSCNSNGAIDPNEVVTVRLGIKNAGTLNTTNLVATLKPTGGVTLPSGPQNYGVVVADGPTVFRSFTFTAANVACGAPVTATLKLQDGAVDFGTITYQFSTGATTTREYDSGNISIPIPDGDPNGVEIPINVTDAITLGDVNVSVRLNHTFAPDLVISVIHPDGTEVPLAFHEGFGGQNYGEGANDCSGTPTVFDDQASIYIGQSREPFVGTFIPESPLSALNGKPSSGTWKLKVVDPWAGDTGTVGCVKLQLTSEPICCGPIISAVPPALVTAESYSPANGAPDPGERVTVSLPLINSGTSSTTNLVATLLATGSVAAPTGPQTYGTLQANGSSVARRFSFTANGNCGDTINLTLALQNGTTSLGTVTFRMRLGTTAEGSPMSFSNTRPITIPGTASGASYGAPANPYSSNIKVSGVSGPQAKMTVTLKNIAHTFPSDIDVLLVSPSGRGFLLMSDALGGADLTGQTYTFDDTAPTILPSKPTTAPPSGSYKPANYDTPDVFPSPAPAAVGFSARPVGPDTLKSTFLDPAAGDLNGTWKLYVVDDSSGDIGAFNGGWQLEFTPSINVCGSQQ